MREVLNIALPSRPWLLWTVAMLLWVAQPILYGKFLIITQQLGWYPVEADSIGIPLIGMAMMSLLGFPVWVILCLRAFRKYPRGARLFEWSRRNAGYSLGITIAFSLCVVVNVLNAISYFQLYRQMRESELAEISVFAIYLMIGSSGWAIIWLAMRSCFIAKKKAE